MDLESSFSSVKTRIQAACERAGRDASSVQLMAVTKGQPPEVVRAAADLGQTLFGENRVQEAKVKIGMTPERLHWHMIGHLQSNKCRDAVHFFERLREHKKG